MTAHEVLMEALIANHIYHPEHEANPRKALADLIKWEVSIALNPLVSSDADALIVRGYKQALLEITGKIKEMLL